MLLPLEVVCFFLPPTVLVNLRVDTLASSLCITLNSSSFSASCLFSCLLLVCSLFSSDVISLIFFDSSMIFVAATSPPTEFTSNPPDQIKFQRTNLSRPSAKYTTVVSLRTLNFPENSLYLWMYIQQQNIRNKGLTLCPALHLYLLFGHRMKHDSFDFFKMNFLISNQAWQKSF